MFDDPGDIDRNGIPDPIQRDPVVVPDDSLAFGEPEPDLGLSGMISPIEAYGAAPAPPELPIAPTPPPDDADDATRAEYQRALLEYQQRLSLMTSTLTNLANMRHESLKAISQNIRD